jgi:hypothetical protein
LHDPERDVQGRSGKALAVALEAARHVESAPRGPAHHFVDQREVRAADLRSAEELDEAPQVVVALPRRLCDPGEDLFGLDRIALDQSLPCGRLDDHDADRVPDDVVEFRGDPGPLMTYGEFREQLPLLLQFEAPAGELVRRLPPEPEHRTGEKAGDGEHDQRHLVALTENQPDDRQIRRQAGRRSPGSTPRPAQRGHQ